ncbi:FUSC family protein [Actinoplanes aureus]|uniref:FUSC family protein n=1 Tax=Actinoplanes aureus TaxID=2792083 RepID=UPI0028154A7D|nr:FUSC family protein [Actinoplanes aureus]
MAAVIAWIIAAYLIGHPDPIFALSATLIVLGESRGRRLRQSIEIVLGVAAGVLVAELVIQILGQGSSTVFIVLLLTIGPMIAAGASSTLVVQSAISAVYLVVIAEPEGNLMSFRFIDALIGGTLALATSQLAAAHNPLSPLVTEARRAFNDLADLLDDMNKALSTCDEPAAQAALQRAQQMTGCVERLRAEVLAAAETLRLRVRRRRRIRQVHQVEATTHQLDHVVGNIWMLARHTVTLTRLHTETPPELSAAVTVLAHAVRAAGESLATDLTGRDDPDQHADQADAAALRAVRIAAKLLASEQPLPHTMIIGQIRTTAVDLLRGVGQNDHDAVLHRVDEALGLTEPPAADPDSRRVPAAT